MVASGAPLAEILDVIARAIDAQSGMLSSILLADEDGRHLRDGVAPGLPAGYRDAIDGLAIGEGIGTCGTAAHRKERVVASDIAHDPSWDDFRDLAREHGLGASWSTPILGSSGELLGTFALYYREPREPSREDLDLIDRAAHLARLAIERYRMDRERAALLARAEAAREELQLIYQLSTAASRAESLERVYDLALDTIQRLLRTDRASALLLDRKRVMRFVAWRGLSDEYRRVVEGHSPWHPYDPEPRAIFVGDVETDPAMASYLPVFRREAIGAIAFVPLVYGERLLGKFMVYFREPRAFGERDRQVASTIADHVAWAVGRLRAERDVREANRKKDEFLAMLGHELRNPLAPIRTAVELMRLRDSEHRYQRELSVLERQVDHLVRLVEDLLDVSRITRGKIELRMERVEIADVVANALEITGPLLEERRQRVQVRVPPNGAAVRGDRARLGQVVSNLLTNAAKYSDPGGQISVAATAEEGAVVLRVRDTGIGISPDVLPHVFDAFTQERQATDRARGGLGLGLAIVKHIVESHGGSVEAASAGRGRGAQFTIRLPRDADAPEPSPDGQKRREAPSGAGLRVLVVDDNADAARMLVEALTATGHTTRCAHDAPSALRVAEEFEPDVAILDIGLPVMDGYQLAARFRARPRLARIPLIALTGYSQEEDRARSARAGFAAHLAKPVDLEALLSTIHGLGPEGHRDSSHPLR